MSATYHPESNRFQVSDPHFKQVYRKKILRRLAKRYGPLLYHHVNFSVSTDIMASMVKKMDKKKPRRGEVVMVIPNAKDQIWLHTKGFYPNGVYRLMTGGIDPGEAPEEALKRETMEETGFTVEIAQCLAVVTYTLTNEQSTLPFVSYVFQTQPVEGTPTPIDSGEAIDGFRAVSVETLLDTTQRLRQLEGNFADWGYFRAITHELTARVLLQNQSFR